VEEGGAGRGEGDLLRLVLHRVNGLAGRHGLGRVGHQARADPPRLHLVAGVEAAALLLLLLRVAVAPVTLPMATDVAVASLRLDNLVRDNRVDRFVGRHGLGRVGHQARAHPPRLHLLVGVELTAALLLLLLLLRMAVAMACDSRLPLAACVARLNRASRLSRGLGLLLLVLERKDRMRRMCRGGHLVVAVVANAVVATVVYSVVFTTVRTVPMHARVMRTSRSPGRRGVRVEM